MRLFIFALTSLLFASSALAASSQKLSKDLKKFEEHKAQITAALSDGKTYIEITSKDRRTVLAALDRMSVLISGAKSVKELPETKRAELFNLQELVNTILTMAEKDSRMICRGETATGSNMRKLRCETLAERKKRQASDQEKIRQLQAISPGINQI